MDPRNSSPYLLFVKPPAIGGFLSGFPLNLLGTEPTEAVNFDAFIVCRKVTSSMFKKRRRTAKAAIRATRAVDENDDDDEDDAGATEAEQLELVREMRSEQRERRHIGGVESNTLLCVSEEATRMRIVKEAEEQDQHKMSNGIMTEESATSDVKALMTNQFTQHVDNARDDDAVHEIRMQAFIEEQMGIAKEPDSRMKESTAFVSDEGNLYAIPEVLKGVGESHAEGLSGNAAPMFMGTGIAEVALPMEFRVKNIQQTKEAKAQLEARREGGFHRRYRAFDKRESLCNISPQRPYYHAPPSSTPQKLPIVSLLARRLTIADTPLVSL
jgi:hypothetical protein